MIHILVLQRGWVVVGRLQKEYDEFVLTNAATIRRWGSSGIGLNGLAEKGPQSGTVLDKGPTIRCHELTVVMRLECNQANWEKHL